MSCKEQLLSALISTGVNRSEHSKVTDIGLCATQKLTFTFRDNLA